MPPLPMPPDPSPELNVMMHQTLFTPQEVRAIKALGDEGVITVMVAAVTSERLLHGLSVPERRSGKPISNGVLAQLIIRELAKHSDLVDRSDGLDFFGPDPTVNAAMNELLQAPGIASEVMRQRTLQRAVKEVIAGLVDPRSASALGTLENLIPDVARSFSPVGQTSQRFVALGLGPSFREEVRAQQAAREAAARTVVTPPVAPAPARSTATTPAASPTTRHAASADRGPMTLQVSKTIWREMEELRTKSERRQRFQSGLSDYEIQSPLRRLSKVVVKLPLARTTDNRLIFEGGSEQDQAVINGLLALDGFQSEVAKLRTDAILSRYPETTPATGAVAFPDAQTNPYSSIPKLDVPLGYGLDGGLRP